MCAASDTNRRHADLSGIGIRVEDKLGNRLSWDRRIYRHDIWCPDNASDWRDIAQEIEAELVVKRRVGRVRRRHHEERIAVCWRAHSRLGGDIAVGTWPVLHDEWLTEPLRQPLAHQPRGDVTCAGGGKSDNDPHGPRRIGLRGRDARDGRQHGAARSQMQKLSARKFQRKPPSHHSITSLARAMNTSESETPREAAVLRLTAM